MGEDLYALLGLSRDASPAAIKRAFRAKARQMHPDAGGSAEGFARLKAAFDTLSDPEARARYDAGAEDRETRERREKMQAFMAFALDSVLLKLRQKTEGLASQELMAQMAARLTERRAELAGERGLIRRALTATDDLLSRPDLAAPALREATARRRTLCEQRLAALDADLASIDLCIVELGGGAAAPDPQNPNFGEWVDVYATVG